MYEDSRTTSAQKLSIWADRSLGKLAELSKVSPRKENRLEPYIRNIRHDHVTWAGFITFERFVSMHDNTRAQKICMKHAQKGVSEVVNHL